MMILAPLSIYFAHEGLAKLCHTQDLSPRLLQERLTQNRPQ